MPRGRSRGPAKSITRRTPATPSPQKKGQVNNGKSVQYAIQDSQKNTKYVGTTNNPRRRAAQHKAAGKLQEGDRFVVQTKAVTRQQAEQQESSKLAEHRNRTGHNPQHNKTNDGKYHQRRMF